MSKETLYTTALVFLIGILVLGMIPAASGIEGEDSYVVDIWVRDRSGTGLNNATVTLKEAGDKMGGADVTSGTTTTYHPTVDNESLGTGTGNKNIFYVSGLPILDWNGDDKINDNDTLIYVDGVEYNHTLFDLLVGSGRILLVTPPASGKPVTATYKWNAGPGHVRFTDVEAGDYVVKASKSGYISEYDDISVTCDSVYTMTLNKYGEAHHALMEGNPLMIIGTGIGALVGLVGYAKYLGAV